MRNPLKTSAILILILLASNVGNSQGLYKQINKALKGSGFSVYQPLRTRDWPGTVIEYRRMNGPFKPKTEIRVLGYEQLFHLEPDEYPGKDNTLFRPDPTVPPGIKKTFKIALSAGVPEIASFVDLELAANYATSVEVTFGGFAVRHVLDRFTVKENSSRIKDAAKAIMLPENGVKKFLVWETLSAEKLDVKFSPKSGFKAKFSVAEIGKLAKGANVDLVTESSKEYTLSFDLTKESGKRMMVGYKPFPLTRKYLEIIFDIATTGEDLPPKTLSPEAVFVLKDQLEMVLEN